MGNDQIRVLVIEDDVDTRDVLTYTLEHEGFAVLTAPDGERGLELAEACRPDVILLDLLMPRLGGKEVARALESHPSLRQIPVVTISASPAENRPDHASAHVRKPFGIDEVTDTLRRVVSATRGAPPSPRPDGIERG